MKRLDELLRRGHFGDRDDRVTHKEFLELAQIHLRGGLLSREQALRLLMATDQILEINVPTHEEIMECILTCSRIMEDTA